MRRTLGTAILALAATFLAACGGPPDDAPTEDFCDVLNDFPTDPDQGAIDDYIKGLNDVGTPDDIPDDARDGFELSIDLLKDMDFDGTPEEIIQELQQARDDLSDEDAEKLDAFEEYQSEECPTV